MLAVVSDRYPRSGAIAISIMGGIGMLSAGSIGGPGLGYSKDRCAAETLKQTQPGRLTRPSKRRRPRSSCSRIPVNAIDGTKLAAAKEAKTPTPDKRRSSRPTARAIARRSRPTRSYRLPWL